MHILKNFFKNIHDYVHGKSLLPSRIVRSGLPMVMLSKKVLFEKPKGFFERVFYAVNQFFKKLGK